MKPDASQLQRVGLQCQRSGTAYPARSFSEHGGAYRANIQVAELPLLSRLLEGVWGWAWSRVAALDARALSAVVAGI